LTSIDNWSRTAHDANYMDFEVEKI